MRRSFLVREALRIAPARPNLSAGLRAGLATTLPLLLAPLIHRPELAWTGLAGFNIVLVDKGGPYRTRADCMLLMTATGVLALALGALSAAQTALALALLSIVVFSGGLMRLFGAEASAVGVVTSVTLVVALARPIHDPSQLFSSVGFYLLGSLWAILISLLLWPLRVYRPARFAVGTALRKLATVASSFIGAQASPRDQLARRSQLGAAREAVENARAAIAASRRGRQGPTRFGEQLLALLEASDQLFAALVALEDGLAAEPPNALPKLPGWIDREASLIAIELARIADALESERVLTETNDAGARQLANSIAPHAQPPHDYLLRILSRALERLDGVVEIARTIDDPTATLPSSRTEPSALSTKASKLSLLRDHWTLDSAMFRHALRMSLSTAIVLLVVRALSLDHGYWATVTCLVIMQPHGAATWTKALQRVLGTLLGAGVAAVVASYVHDPIAIGGFVFVFVALGMTLLPLNYGVFAVFLTPGFVLLAETGAGRLDLAGVRVANTLLGALIALLGSRLLFPVRERDQFRPLIVDALGALESLLQVAASPQPSAAELGSARRKIGLALLNAEASYQRLLTETGLASTESEALLTLLLYVHRLASGLIALSVAEGSVAHRELIERAATLGAALSELRTSLAERRDPAPIAEHESPDAAPSERINRLFDQLAVLRTATLRWNAGAER